MTPALAYTQTLETETCCNCGIEFGIPFGLQKQLLESHKNFYCPNGHAQHYTAETDSERLAKELEKEQRRARWAEEENKRITRKLKRTEKRVANGVCPCCNRTFINLARHMKCKHKEFVEEPKK